MAPLSVDIVPTSPWERQFPSLSGYNPIAGVSEPDPNFSGLHQRGTRPESLDTWQAFRDARQAARSILATAHIGGKPHSLTYAVGGNLIKLTGHYPTANVRRLGARPEDPYLLPENAMRGLVPMDDCEAGARARSLLTEDSTGGFGARGRVVGFSRGSRSRLMQRMASLPRERLCMPWFVTLTYPAVYPDDPAVWTAHRRAFLRRLYYEYGTCAVIWRLEPQRRGAPHFHLMVFSDKPMAIPLTGRPGLWWGDLSQWWYDIVGSNDPWHAIHGVRDVQRVRSWNGVMSYASKYLAKESEIKLPGRQWGIEYKALLLIRLVRITMPSKAWYACRRALFALERARSGSRLRAMGHHAGMWRMLPQLVGEQLALWAVPLTYPPRRLYDTCEGRTHLPHNSGGKARHGRCGNLAPSRAMETDTRG